MKTEFTDVSETRKHIAFEIPPDVVEDEIARVAQGYSKSAKVPGFRQGKVPAAVVRQRYRDQILHDVAHDLIPRLVGSALRERKLEPVAAPDIRDVVLEEGKPLTFLAEFETLPELDLGDYTGISLRKPPALRVQRWQHRHNNIVVPLRTHRGVPSPLPAGDNGPRPQPGGGWFRR